VPQTTKRFSVPQTTKRHRPFQTLRLRLLDIRGMKFGSLNSMRIVVHSKKSLTTRISKEIVPCQQEFPI